MVVILDAETIKKGMLDSPDETIEQVVRECARRKSDLWAWTELAIGVVEALGQLGVDDDVLLALLNRIGPLYPYEEEWRLARLRVLQEMDVWRGSTPNDLGISALFEVVEILVQAGIEPREAQRLAVDLARAGPIKLRGNRLNLSERARSMIETIVFDTP